MNKLIKVKILNSYFDENENEFVAKVEYNNEIIDVIAQPNEIKRGWAKILAKN